jgi:calcineurin-like phosphoesterase family protein
MASTFLVSDTHFGHEKICTFYRADGTPLRPWDNYQEMEDALVENWNSVVKEGDRVYHLGDVALTKSGLKVLGKLNGRKVLIRGNHDIYSLKDYTKYFEDIRGCFIRDLLAFTHVPVHPESFRGKWIGNIHGHLHYIKHDDPRYYNVCVECTDYTPIDYEAVRAYFDDRAT